MTIVWSGVVAFIAYKMVDMVIGLRVRKSRNAKVWTSPATANRLTTVTLKVRRTVRQPAKALHPGRFFYLVL